MKNNFYLLLFFIFLYGCSTTIEDEKTSNLPVIEQENDIPLTIEHIDISSTLIENTLAVFDETYYIVGDFPSDEELLAQLKAANHDATNAFIENHLFYKDYSCTDGYCPSIPGMLMSMKYGWDEKVVEIDNEHFQVSMLYPSFRWRDYNLSSNRTNDLIQSYRQTLDIVLEDGKWKLNALSNEDEDMNLQQEDIQPFVTRLGYDFDEIISMETTTIIDREETVYTFSELHSDYTFEILARTGFISSSGGLDYSPYNAIDLEWDEQEIIREDETPYLAYFEDWSFYKDQIDSSTEMSQQILNTLDELDRNWIDPPYFEFEREEILALRKGYYDLVYKTFGYLTEKYPDEQNIATLNAYFDTFDEQRAQYFHQFSISHQFVTSESVVYIIDEAWIMRNFVLDLLVNESSLFE